MPAMRLRLWIALWLMTLAVRARADSRAFDVDHLQPAITSGQFLATEGEGLGETWRWRSAIDFSYANRLLLADTPAGRMTLVGARSLVEAAAAVSLGLGISVALAVPVLFDQTSQDAASRIQAALGDLRAVGRFDFVVRPHLNSGLLIALRLPTATSREFFGEGSIVFEPRFVVATRYRMLRAAVNLGMRFREARVFQDLDEQHELFASAAIAVVPARWIEVLGEIHMDTALSSRFFRSAVTPVEVLAGLGTGWRGFRVRGAAGCGLDDGLGAPRFRVLAAVSYQSPVRPARPIEEEKKP